MERVAGYDVVYHLVPTSNHNRYSNEYNGLTLFIILFLHQTTTKSGNGKLSFSCLSSCSYIKPQHLMIIYIVRIVVYHLVPTSNHNLDAVQVAEACVVYHLVPTSNHNSREIDILCRPVVYHLVPTSNHNGVDNMNRKYIVVYHLVPTSNHNHSFLYIERNIVVYHLVPTSNHNCVSFHADSTLVVYHLVPTSNHNFKQDSLLNRLLFIILFLHQTTTYSCKSTGNQ